MKTWLVTFVAVATANACIGIALADEPVRGFDISAPVVSSQEWKPNPDLWRELTPARKDSTIPIGSSGFAVSGPLTAAFPRETGNEPKRRSVGRRLLAVPLGLLGLFVPQRMPTPPESTGGYFKGYFKRGESLEPWATVATREASPYWRDYGCSLLSISR